MHAAGDDFRYAGMRRMPQQFSQKDNAAFRAFNPESLFSDEFDLTKILEGVGTGNRIPDTDQ